MTLLGASVVGIGALNGVVKVGKYTLIRYSGNLINEGGIVPSGPISNFTLGGVFTSTSRATMVLSRRPGRGGLDRGELEHQEPDLVGRWCEQPVGCGEQLHLHE